MTLWIHPTPRFGTCTPFIIVLCVLGFFSPFFACTVGVCLFLLVCVWQLRLPSLWPEKASFILHQHRFPPALPVPISICGVGVLCSAGWLFDNMSVRALRIILITVFSIVSCLFISPPVTLWWNHLFWRITKGGLNTFILYVYRQYMIEYLIWNHWTVLVIHSTIYIFLLLDSRCGFDLRKSQQMTHFSLNYDQPDCFVMFCSSPTRHVDSKSSEVCSKSAHISSKLCSRIAYLRWIIIDWLHDVQLRKSCKNLACFTQLIYVGPNCTTASPKKCHVWLFFFFAFIRS